MIENKNAIVGFDVKRHLKKLDPEKFNRNHSKTIIEMQHEHEC